LPPTDAPTGTGAGSVPAGERPEPALVVYPAIGRSIPQAPAPPVRPGHAGGHPL